MHRGARKRRAMNRVLPQNLLEGEPSRVDLDRGRPSSIAADGRVSGVDVIVLVGTMFELEAPVNCNGLRWDEQWFGPSESSGTWSRDLEAVKVQAQKGGHQSPSGALMAMASVDAPRGPSLGVGASVRKVRARILVETSPRNCCRRERVVACALGGAAISTLLSVDVSLACSPPCVSRSPVRRPRCDEQW